jgi:hypothetical protein
VRRRRLGRCVNYNLNIVPPNPGTLNVIHSIQSMRLTLLAIILFGYTVTSANAETIFDSERCKSEAKKVQDIISTSTVCASNTDCRWEFFGCPWGCGTFINGAKINDIKAAIAHYYTQECWVCKYRCQARKSTPQPGCMNNRCVDLSARDG